MKAKKIAVRFKAGEIAKAFPRCYITAESMIFGFMSNYAKGYNGGHWEYYKTENDVFFMVPDQGYHLSLENYFSEFVTAEMAGLISTMTTLNRLCWIAYHKGDHALSQYLVKKQGDLKEYVFSALNSDQQTQFFRAID